MADLGGIMEQIQEETILALLIDKPAEGIRILTAQYGGLVYSITWRRLQGCLRKEDIEECVSDVFFELYHNEIVATIDNNKKQT